MRKIALLCVLTLVALAGRVSAQTTVGGTATMGVSAASPITVSLAPPAATVAVNATQMFVLTVTNDMANAGANLALSCTGSCGTLSLSFARTGSSITYTAPSSANAVVLTATSAQDSTRFVTVPITITALPPPAVVNFVNTPAAQAAASVNTFPITTTVGNSAIVGVEVATADVISSVQVCAGATCTTATQACTPTAICSGSTSPGGASYQYYAIHILAGQNSVNINNSSPSGTIGVYVLDCSGLGSFDTATVASNQTTATTTPTGPSITPSAVGELLVAGVSSTGNVNSVASPYTFTGIPGGDGVAYAISSSTSPSVPSYSATSGTWSGFQGAYVIGVTPVVVRVNVAPGTANVQVTATQQFTAIVTNDPANGGVTWLLTGGSCSGATCGHLSSSSSASGTAITYTAPTTVPGASVSRVQHTTGVVAASSGTLPIVSSTATDILCGVAVWNLASGSLTVTDSASQTYSAVVSGTGTSTSAAMACKPNTAGGVTSLNFSVTGASPTVMEYYALEYAGVATISPVDQTASTAGSSSPMDSGFASATTNANDVLIGFGYNGASLTFTAGNDGQGDNYTLLDQESAIGSATEDFFTTSATNTYKATLIPATPSGSRMFFVALKASAAGSSNVTLTATSVTDGTKTAAATINVGAAAIVGVAVSPTSASTTAGGSTVSVNPTVSNDPPNAGVTWILSGPGTLSSTGGPSGSAVTYTPPASISSTQTVTITATSVDDNTKSASTTITVSTGSTGGGSSVCNPNCPAFAGAGGVAQGAGAVATGGRGGGVYNINDLTDDTHGGCTANSTATCSLRDCIQDTANINARTCIFMVSGAITNTSRLAITKPNITIAGETAPGGPITLHSADSSGCPSHDCGTLWIETSNVIVRYITYDGNAPGVTPGPSSGTVGYEIGNGSAFHVILDHTTARWWGNKVFVINSNDSGTTHDITVQWSLMYEPNVGHPVILELDTSCGAPTCSALNSVNQDYHHNMGINYNHRWPLTNIHSLRWVNNISYDALNQSQDFTHMAWGGLVGDYIGNVVRDGPDSNAPVHNYLYQSNPCNNDASDSCPSDNPGPPSIYMLNNIGHTCSATVTNSCTMRTLNSPTHAVNDASQISQTFQGWEGGESLAGSHTVAPVPSGWFRSTPLPAETFPITQDPAENLDNVVPATVGNSQHLNPATCTGDFVSYRDSQDSRVIQQYFNRGPGGAYLGTGDNSGVYLGPTTSPAVQPGTPCTSTLHDGIPDTWRSFYGVSGAANATDPITKVTYLDDYLGGLVP